MDFLDDVFDLLLGLFLGAVIFVVAFGVVLPTVYDTTGVNKNVVEDKTAPTLGGYEIDTGFDGTFTWQEGVLMGYIQDYGLPEPKVFKVPTQSGSLTNSVVVEVGGDYQEYNNVAYMRELISGGLKSVDNTGLVKYKIDYSYGDTSAKSDDFYFYSQQ